jgi:hypothetical protein
MPQLDPISPDEVAAWFTAERVRVPKLPVVSAVAERCTAYKARAAHPKLSSAVVHVRKGFKAAKAFEAWALEHAAVCEARGVPPDPDVTKLLAAAQKLLPRLEVPRAYVKPENRWQTYIHALHDLIVAAMRSAGYKVTGAGAKEGPVMRVLCQALHAIDGQYHSPATRWDWLNRNPNPRSLPF